ncbi:glycosyltransferase family 4 protein [Campylobacter curvus]|uniref:glycosyltransferase family 4 protein n=1 Tax=Campylobacter curvus TaxID=200 RepID=UPI0014703816|nr:glycosyltransferase family 4 protein [Campylobacter curvus]
MRIYYIYPEQIPQKNAREISVLNTFFELSKICDIKFVMPKIDCSMAKLNDKFKLDLTDKNFIFLKKEFLFFKSTKIFNFHLLKLIRQSGNEDCVFFTRHLKIANFLLKHKFKTQKVCFEAHECFSLQNKTLFDLEKFILKNSDIVFAHNISTKNALEDIFDFKFKNAAILYNGAKTCEHFINKRFDFSQLPYFGSFIPWKGVDLLLDLLKMQDELKLKIYGNDTTLNAASLKEDLNKNKLDKRVEFMGFLEQDKVIGYLKKNDKILIIPSKESVYSRFSTPLKIYEYLSTCNIVLAPDFEPVKEIITDGVNGFLYRAGNVKSLSEKLQEIKSLSNERLNEISKNGFLKMKDFSWQSRAAKIVDTIKANHD